MKQLAMIASIALLLAVPAVAKSAAPAGGTVSVIAAPGLPIPGVNTLSVTVEGLHGPKPGWVYEFCFKQVQLPEGSQFWFYEKTYPLNDWTTFEGNRVAGIFTSPSAGVLQTTTADGFDCQVSVKTPAGQNGTVVATTEYTTG